MSQDASVHRAQALGEARCPRVAIDCSHILRSRNRTGIPRVVRNLAHHGPNQRDLGVEAVPVALTYRGYCRVPQAWFGSRHASLLGRLARKMKLVVFGVLALIARAIKRVLRAIGKQFPDSLRPLLKRGARSAKWLLQAARSQIHRGRAAISKAMLTLRLWSAPLEFGPGDVLMLCDSNWDETVLWKWIGEWRARGGLVGAVVYDLIPLRRPEFVDDRLYNVFDTHLRRVARESDFVVGISRETSRDFLEFARACRQPGWSDERAGSFRLGAGGWASSSANASASCSTTLAQCASHPMFLAVGTIEIRKNLATVLNAFDALWSKGASPALVVVGKPGYGGRATIERMLRSPEFGRRLFWLSDASDSDLEACYRSAAALIMPSKAEGFGLPVVEALQRGKPVIASNIPTHLEIAADFCEFFDPASADQLEFILRNHVARGRPAELRKLEDFQWPDWAESTRECLRECRRMHDLGARCKPGPALH